MGRVKKYKKIKSCDPFYKGPKNINKGYDLPPSKQSGQSSKSFRYFLKSTQDNLPGKPSDKSKDVYSNDKKSKKITNKRHKIVEKNDDEMTRPEKELRYKKEKGESNPSFLARVELETNQKLITVQKKASGCSDRRKRYNKERKLKHQLKKLGVNLEDAEGMDFKDLKDHIKFGEVAQRPPELPSITKKKSLQNTESIDGRDRAIELYRNKKMVHRTSSNK